VARGEVVLDPKIAGNVVQQMRRLADEVAMERPTARELEILRDVAQGLTSHEIAERKVLSESTVKSHIQNLMLVAQAMRHKLL